MNLKFGNNVISIIYKGLMAMDKIIHYLSSRKLFRERKIKHQMEVGNSKNS